MIFVVGAVAGTVSLKAGAEITIVLVARVLELAVLVLQVLSKVLAIAEVNGGSVSEVAQSVV